MFKIKQSNPNWVLLILFCFIIFSSPLYAQHLDKVFKSRLKEANMAFKMPKGFIERDSITLHDCGDGKFPGSSLIYSIINPDSTIIIGFFNIGGLYSGDHGNSVDMALRYQKVYADTINYTSKVYKRDYSEQKFNAHVAGEYTRPCPVIFLNEYTNSRVFFLANNTWGQGYMIYYCKDSARLEWEKLMRNGPAILKFKKL